VTKRIDAEGYKSGSSDATRYGWTYTYDLAGRVVTELDPELESRNKPGAFTKSYRYNAAGDVVSETDALGNESLYAYDAAGRLLSVTDPLGVPVSYSYDKAGNKLFMTDGRGKVTTYAYGAFGMLRSVKNASQLTIRDTYDLAGNMARMVDRNGNATEYAYDSRNLLLRKSVEETGDEIEYGYDEVGNRVSMTDESGAVCTRSMRRTRWRKFARTASWRSRTRTTRSATSLPCGTAPALRLRMGTTDPTGCRPLHSTARRQRTRMTRTATGSRSRTTEGWRSSTHTTR